jgi:undecaprenyl-diphosphatase
MSRRTVARSRRDLVPLIVVTLAAAIFTILIILVRLRWRPLESVDHSAAARINELIAGHAGLIAVIKAITLLGSTAVLSGLIGVAVIFLLIRRRWRLAVYLLVTGAGALVLGPVLKSVVGRLRPVLAHPVTHGTGNSFPSGHALGSIVCYGAILLVFVPVARGRWRTAFATTVVIGVALIGISRILLGVHYLSDVIGGWAIGIIWLGVTTFAFEVSRAAAGLPVTHPATEGLEPEDSAALRLATPEAVPADSPLRRRGQAAAAVVAAWVLIVGVIAGIGKLITKFGNGNELGDRTIPHWLAAHRTPGLTSLSLVFTTLGGTACIASAALVIGVVFLAVTRRWRPVVYIATLMAGELAGFLAAAAVVKRPRPDVSHLDHRLPTSAYPSGHTAATCCVYIALAILVIGHARGWWRWLFLIPAAVLPVMVALSRLYRGEHHPTDVLGGMLFAGLWLVATSRLIKPNADARGSEPRRREPADGARSAHRQPGRSRARQLVPPHGRPRERTPSQTECSSAWLSTTVAWP